MSFLHGLKYRLGVLLAPRRYARERAEETRFHLEREAAQRAHAERGAREGDTGDWRAAHRKFGNVTYHTEEARQMAGLGFFDTAGQDLRFALRGFRRAPAFTAVAVLTLAVGIGANTAIFSAVNAMLLRPLPFPEPERLMKVSMTVPPRAQGPARSDAPWSFPKWRVFRDAQTIFEPATAFTAYEATVRANGEAERLQREFIDRNYLPLLGIRPMLGRNLVPAEDAAPGAPRVALIGHALWQRVYNADPKVLGQSISVDNAPHTIVGVMPPGFQGLSGTGEVWLPLMSQDAEQLEQAWSHSLTVVGRRKPGVSEAQAMTVAKQLGERVDRAYPHPSIKDEHWGVEAKPLDALRVEPVVRRSLLVLFGAAGLVLLIACVNVANLFLVRASGRRREIAVRLAIGAGRGRLVRQLLTESTLLAALGGAAGVAVAYWGVRLLAALRPEAAFRQRFVDIGVVSFSSIQLDPWALGFAAFVSVLTGVLFGLVPALQATHPSLSEALKDGGARPKLRRLRALSGRGVLAALEVALALVLLAGSGLMLRSLGNLMGIDPGFRAEQTLTLRLNTREGFGRDSLPGFYDALLERLRALPGVTSAALGDCPPLGGPCSGTVLAHRDRPPAAPGSEPFVGVYWVSPEWARTLDVPLKRGRMFGPADRMGAPKVVVVNETAAKKYWPGEDPIGKPVSVGQGGFWNDTATVVGVVGDVRFGSIDSLPQPDVFLSYYQSPRGRMMVFLRTAGDPAALAPAARRAIREMAPDLPIYDIETLESRVGDAMAATRFSTVLLALFGAMALGLAMIGIYGVIAFAVAQRTREIGIRMALGATRGRVVRLVLGQGMGIAVAGAVAGLVAALAATRVLGSLLYGVTPSDPTTFGAMVALLALAVIAACWIPARRASGIEPTEALREG